MTGLKRRFWAAEHWCQAESGKVHHPFEALVLAVALLMLPAVLIQDGGLHSPWGRVADGLGAVVWLVFTVELAFILYHAPDRKRALRSHWHDLMFVIVIFPLWAPLFASFGTGWLRGWRLARLGAVAGRVFRAERLLSRRHNLPYVAALTAVLISISGIAVHETDPQRFPNIWRGLWFAIVTVTTVGYDVPFCYRHKKGLVEPFFAVLG